MKQPFPNGKTTAFNNCNNAFFIIAILIKNLTHKMKFDTQNYFNTTFFSSLDSLLTNSM